MQTSSGVRLSNIFFAPSFEEIEGYIGLGLSMGQPICHSVHGLRLPLEIASWNYACGLTMLMKGSFAFGVADLYPFI